MNRASRPTLAALSLVVSALAFGCRGMTAAPPRALPSADPSTSAAGTSAAGTLIVDVTVVSPERPAPLAGAWVGIRDGKIAFVGSGPPPAAASGWPRIDGGGRFLAPGLIDGHVHLQAVPGLSWDRQRDHKRMVDAYFEQLPRSYLYYGFTTLIDLAPQDPKVMRRIAARPLAPDLASCGPPVPIGNGYPMVFAPRRFRFLAFPNFLWDPAQAAAMPASMSPAEHDSAAVVARVVEAGGRCVKTFVEDGFGPGKRWPVPAPGLLAELAAASHAAGLPLLVHANSFDSYRIALDGGADVLVHGLWTWDEHQPSAGAAAGADGSLPPALERMVERIAEQGTAVMPTLQVLAGDRALFDPAFLDDPALAEVLPAELLAWYASDDGGWFADQLLAEGATTPEAAYDGHSEALARDEAVTRALAGSAARLLFGSDTPSGPGYGNPPGYNGYLELQRWAAAGIEPRRIFAAATLDTARAFGLETLYGTVEAGKVANLLLLRDNPLDSPRAYGSLETVILRGRPLARPSLRATAVSAQPAR